MALQACQIQHSQLIERFSGKITCNLENSTQATVEGRPKGIEIPAEMDGHRRPFTILATNCINRRRLLFLRMTPQLAIPASSNRGRTRRRDITITAVKRIP